jgi:phage terminase Nu1 subunit (DNA packaging protein)
MADLDRDVDANELAVWLGVTATAVRDAARRGVLERSKIGFALKENVQKYCAHLRKLVVERSEGPAASARAKLLAEQCEHARLKNEKLRGDLLDRSLVENEWTGILGTVRARLLAAPARIARTSPHLTRVDLAVIDGEIRAALEELADGAAHDEFKTQTS